MSVDFLGPSAAPDPERRRLPRGVTIAVVVVLLAAIGVRVATHHTPPPPAALPPPPSPALPTQFGVRDFYSGSTNATDLRALVCTGVTACTVESLSPAALSTYLAVFTGAQPGTGALVYGPGHVALGEGAHALLPATNVTLDLTVARFAPGSTPMPTNVRTRAHGIGLVIYRVRRGGFELTAAMTFDGLVRLPLGQVQTWLAQTPLPA